jgi:hypothetical protein
MELLKTASMCPWLTGSDIMSLEQTQSLMNFIEADLENHQPVNDTFDPTDYGHGAEQPSDSGEKPAKKVHLVEPACSTQPAAACSSQLSESQLEALIE